jgi:ParB family transcriptional regulator, chromosome partitioning protein
MSKEGKNLDTVMEAATSEEPKRAARRPHGLGRGLSSLLGEVAQEESVASGVSTTKSGTSSLQTIDISAINPHPGQPRRHFDDGALQELADSIARRGVIQPIVVRPMDGGYQIVAGERRWRAAQRAMLHRIPAIVRDFNDAETMEIALVENVQRQDLNPIEEAEAYSRLIADFGHSQEALGRLVGKSRSHIANLIRLLDLPLTVRQAVMEGRISMGHARTLIGVENAEAIARTIEEKGLSVRETERLTNQVKGKTEAKAPRGSGTAVARDSDIVALEHHLSDILGVKIQIAHRADGVGTLTMQYSTLDQLDMLCQRLSGEPI